MIFKYDPKKVFAGETDDEARDRLRRKYLEFSTPNRKQGECPNGPGACFCTGACFK